MCPQGTTTWTTVCLPIPWKPEVRNPAVRSCRYTSTCTSSSRGQDAVPRSCHSATCGSAHLFVRFADTRLKTTTFQSQCRLCRNLHVQIIRQIALVMPNFDTLQREPLLRAIVAFNIVLTLVRIHQRINLSC